MRGVNSSNNLTSFLPVIAMPAGDCFWKSFAITVGKVVLRILTFSAVLVGTGKLMQIGGVKLISEPGSDLSLTTRIASNLGLGLKTTGNGLFLVGKYAFLSIAVPTYTIVWVLPKWLVTQGIPKVVNLVHQYVIVPISQGIVQAMRFLNKKFLEITQAVYNYALKPLGKVVIDAFTWTWKSIVIPVSNSVVQALRSIKDILVRSTQAVYNYALKPLGQFTGRTIGIVYEYAGHVFIAVSNTASGVINSIYETYAWLHGRLIA